MGPMIPKEMIYNLHYGKVRGDILPPPHGTNTSYSVISVKKIAFGNKQHTTGQKMGVSGLLRLFISSNTVKPQWFEHFWDFGNVFRDMGNSRH